VQQLSSQALETQETTIVRRVLVGGALVLVLTASVPSPAQDARPKISDPKLLEAVAKFEEANAKFNDGDPDPWIAAPPGPAMLSSVTLSGMVMFSR